MRQRRPPNSLARPLAALALASALLGGCAEMHRGVETVGRVGATPAAAEDADAAPYRTDVKTVRPRGAPRAAAVDAAEAPPRVAVAAAVPSPREIFDFHPAGTGADGWRQPFVIDANDGPLAADVRRSAAELRQFLADQRSGGAKAAGDRTGAVRTAKPRCGETDVAQGKPGCGSSLPRSAAMPDLEAPR